LIPQTNRFMQLSLEIKLFGGEGEDGVEKCGRRSS
jgi:hypothetical protein